MESHTRHDFQWCKCGACAADGGKDYIKRAWDPDKGNEQDIIEELSISSPLTNHEKTGWQIPEKETIDLEPYLNGTETKL